MGLTYQLGWLKAKICMVVAATCSTSDSSTDNMTCFAHVSDNSNLGPLTVLSGAYKFLSNSAVFFLIMLICATKADLNGYGGVVMLSYGGLLHFKA